MKIKITEPLRKAFRLLSEMTSEADITTDKKGLHIKEDCFAGQTYAFLDYNCKGLTEDTFRINIKKISSILSLAKADEEVTLETGEQFTIIIGKRQFKLLPIITKGFDENVLGEISKLEFVVKAEIILENFKNIMKEAKMMTDMDAFWLVFKKDGFEVSSGDVGSNYVGEFSASVDKFAEGKSKYSIDLMNQILEAKLVTATFEFGLATHNRKDHFLRFSFEDDDLEFSAILLPRVED